MKNNLLGDELVNHIENRYDDHADEYIPTATDKAISLFLLLVTLVMIRF